jgi:hypothetical protein
MQTFPDPLAEGICQALVRARDEPSTDIDISQVTLLISLSPPT